MKAEKKQDLGKYKKNSEFPAGRKNRDVKKRNKKYFYPGRQFVEKTFSGPVAKRVTILIHFFTARPNLPLLNKR